MPILQDAALVALFCSVDDFCKIYLPILAAQSLPAPGKRNRARSLSQSEIMTLFIAFQQSQFRNFKAFYLGFVCHYWKHNFPRLVSYSRFLEYVPSVVGLLATYLKTMLGKCRGLSFIDSTCLPVCHNKRIHAHKVFADTAKRGKTSVDWFFGFKLHLAINDKGELTALAFTQGNVHDVRVAFRLVHEMFGKVYADKGYLSEPLRKELQERGIELITKVRKNMPPPALSEKDKKMLKKRSLIETVIGQIKNISQVQQTRHRANTGFLSNLFAALIAYCRQVKKPTIQQRIALP